MNIPNALIEKIVVFTNRTKSINLDNSEHNVVLLKDLFYLIDKIETKSKTIIGNDKKLEYHNKLSNLLNASEQLKEEHAKFVQVRKDKVDKSN